MTPISSTLFLLFGSHAVVRAARVTSVNGVSETSGAGDVFKGQLEANVTEDLAVEEQAVRDASGSHVDMNASSGLVVAGQMLRDRYVLKQFLHRKEFREYAGGRFVGGRVGGPGGTPGQVFPTIDRGHLAGTPKHLGTGSFGDVWEAYDQDTKQNVAVKIFYTKQGGAPKFMTWLNAAPHELQELESSEKECSIVQQIVSHKALDPVGASHICMCFGEHISDARNTDKAVFLVLEMCGEELADKMTALKNARAVDVRGARSLTKQMLEALNYMAIFDPPLIHHDLKPANVAVTKEGRVKFIDWGGLVFGSPENMHVPAVATPLYTPPECDRGRCAFQLPAYSYDVYAVGLMYMELLCPSMDYNEWARFRPLNARIVQQLINIRCPSLKGQINLDIGLLGQMISARPALRPSPGSCLKSQPLV